MILLGVLSQYSWVDFITFIVIVDAIVLAIGFALDKFVWSKDSSLTKNEQRSQREEEKEEKRDYRKLSEAASDYNDVVSVDENFDEDDSSDSMSIYEDYVPSTSDIAERMDAYDEDEDAPSQEAVGDEDEDEDDMPSRTDKDEDEPHGFDEGGLEERNEQAQASYLCDREDGELITTSDDFDSLSNMEYLDDDDQKAIYATTDHDEELTDVSIKQGEEDEFREVAEGRGVVPDDDFSMEYLEAATVKSMSDIIEPNIQQDDLEDPDDGPHFDNE